MLAGECPAAFYEKWTAPALCSFLYGKERFPLLGDMEMRRTGFYQKHFKRWADCLLALLGLFVAALPLAFAAVWIPLDSSGPILFSQQRMGRDGKPFRIW